jgi:hypothetical protein
MEELTKAALMSRWQQFWLGWRKEIVRGAVIFAAVLGVGLAASRMWGRIPFDMANNFNWEDFGNRWDSDHDEHGDRNWRESFRYSAKIAPARWVWIRNTNGPISVEETDGESLMVFADKRSRRSDPNDVEIRAVERNGTVTICALWVADEAECGDEGEYHMKNTKRTDIAVRFRVLLPKGIKLDASTVNGPVEVEGAAAALTLATVNGQIHANATGPIRATTVNGSIHADMENMPCTPCSTEAVELKTVNGSITAMLPSNINADLDATTVSGRVSTDLPIQLVGRVTPRAVKARIGKGGRRLALSTVNGSIEITQQGADNDDEHDHPKDHKPN